MLRTLILLLISLIQLSVSAEISKPPIQANWSLVLNENFDSFDRTRWNTKLETNKLTYRRSKCFFMDENVKAEKGNLVLTTKRETLKLTDADGNERKLKYTSGLINSFRKLKYKYGYFEARMKLPQARGLWPAFWMMPDRSLAASSPFIKGIRSTKVITDSTIFLNGKGMEIDVMEYLTEWNGKKIHYAAHWGGYQDGLKSHHGYHKTQNNNPQEGYHKYAVYWAKDLLVWFYDDKEIARLESKRVSDVPAYLIFSTNLGGWATWRRERDKLPAHTYIDYVRVWQKAS